MKEKADAEQQGWKTRIHPLEVGCRVLTARSAKLFWLDAVGPTRLTHLYSTAWKWVVHLLFFSSIRMGTGGCVPTIFIKKNEFAHIALKVLFPPKLFFSSLFFPFDSSMISFPGVKKFKPHALCLNSPYLILFICFQFCLFLSSLRWCMYNVLRVNEVWTWFFQHILNHVKNLNGKTHPYFKCVLHNKIRSSLF